MEIHFRKELVGSCRFIDSSVKTIYIVVHKARQQIGNFFVAIQNWIEGNVFICYE